MGDSTTRPPIQSILISTSVGPTQFAISRLPSGAPKPKLLDQVRLAIRTRHLSAHTEQAYIGWIKRFIFFHNTRHPAEMGAPEIGRFLSSQWVFPATSHYTDAISGEKRRHHLHDRSCRRPSRRPGLKQVFTSRPAAIRFGVPLPLICSGMDTTYEQCRSYWGTGT